MLMTDPAFDHALHQSGNDAGSGCATDVGLEVPFSHEVVLALLLDESCHVLVRRHNELTVITGP